MLTHVFDMIATIVILLYVFMSMFPALNHYKIIIHLDKVAHFVMHLIKSIDTAK